jgi:hypothetical protein
MEKLQTLPKQESRVHTNTNGKTIYSPLKTDTTKSEPQTQLNVTAKKSAANGKTKPPTDLHAQLSIFSQYIGGHFTRVNVMGTPRKRSDGSMFFTPSTTREGTADIVGVYNGRYVAVEVKIGLDRQSKDQKEVQKEIEQAGGIYIVAKTFPQFTDEFRKYLLSPIS